MVPQAAPEHPSPVTVQVTPWSAGSLTTVAVKSWVASTTTVAEVGDTETLIATIVTVADADLLLSATEVAVTVTVAGVGTAAGAV
jgi:hypothetical protein